MKVIYMGTPDFAVGPLEAIVKAGHEVVVAVTQPDKPKGRSKELKPCPVKECALAHGIPVFQPERMKRPEAIEALKAYPADIAVVAAFGQILPPEVLNFPKYGCINIHASLLPKYRGAAPIQRAVLEGEKESGVTIMQMEEGLDTGDILIQERLSLAADETAGSLFDKLAGLGARMIPGALEAIEKGNVHPVKQEEALSTYAKMLKKEEGCIEWSKSAEEIERLVRGMDPWPSAYTHFNGKTLKIWKAGVLSGDQAEAGNKAGKASPKAGELVGLLPEGPVVACGEGSLLIRELQLEGKKRMGAADFLRGVKLTEGTVFGE